jgi:hypothetical protein
VKPIRPRFGVKKGDGSDVDKFGAVRTVQPVPHGVVSFALPPGSYTVVASYLGAESGTQTVELRPVLKDGNWSTHDHVVTLTMAPIE